jgi:polyisoprenoid-binding protein YceI
MTTTSSSAAPPLARGTWALDPAHTCVSFAITHLGISKIRGRFGEVAAELVIGPTAEECSVTATIALASIDTGNTTRDAHLRTPEFLDVERRPTMSYRSTRVQGEGSSWAVDGELTIGDITRPVPLAVELGGVQAFFDGTRHGGLAATAEIRRADFDLGFGAHGAGLGEVVEVQLDLQFIEPK